MDDSWLQASDDKSIRLWRTRYGACVAIIPELASKDVLLVLPSIHACLSSPRLVRISVRRKKIATASSTSGNLDPTVLLGQPATPSVTYTSAKIVLVGDSGVGKTGLGWRLAHGEFKEHSSTHGMQFWLLKQLCKQRLDGAQCEAVLWDLAGQPDYRLTHALFLDDADLALVLFDPTHNDDPLSGVEFWLKQLKVEARAS